MEFAYKARISTTLTTTLDLSKKHAAVIHVYLGLQYFLISFSCHHLMNQQK